MSFTRRLVLTLAGNAMVNQFASKYGMKLGATRFVAGETLSEAIKKVASLNQEGLIVTLDHLGESVLRRDKAEESTQDAIDILSAIDEAKVDSNISVKLTQLGLDIDPTFCLENMEKITQKAKETNNFVRIDMEDSTRVQVTLDIFQELLQKFGKEHIGVVIQSYLYRSEEDVRQLSEEGVNIRMVKGAYKEPKEVAFPSKKDVDENLVHLVQSHLREGCYTAIASHDEKLIDRLKKWIKEEGIAENLYEFQMLYGVKNELQRQLVREGYKVRVYTPYGKEWYPYFTRRLAERPANAWFIAKNFFK